jgi:hypothetical protein
MSALDLPTSDTAAAPGSAPVMVNGFAVASLVLGLLWFFWLGSVLAVVFGHAARGQLRRSSSTYGAGRATAGLALGYGALALLVLTVATGSHAHLVLQF